MKQKPPVSVIGLGYVGLCTAVTFANKGLRTIGVDIDKSKIERIRRGEAPFHEPRLNGMLKDALRTKRMSVTDSIEETAKTSATFIAVGTPPSPDGSIDLSYLEASIRQLGKLLRDKAGYHLVVIKSTVVPGTTTGIVRGILAETVGKEASKKVGVCANPEFLREGSAISDSLAPDKIVIGALDDKSGRVLRNIYRAFFGSKMPPTILTTPETAEMIKYSSNAFLATKVSFINTVANICQSLAGVDVNSVAQAIGLDPRIGPLFLRSGPGYGGSCFHKDLQALIHFGRKLGYNPILFEATESVNEQQALKVVELAREVLHTLDGRRIAVLGLAFKEETDDVREAASIRVINQLVKAGAQVVAWDPMAIKNAKKVLPTRVLFVENLRSAIKNSDCAIIMTEWNGLRKLSAQDYSDLMETPNLVDARRLYNPEDFKELNFKAIGLGGPSIST